MIDANLYLSRWPARRLPLDETPKLVAALKTHGIKEAWAGSFDALLHKDIGGVNARLVEVCKTHGDGALIPFGSSTPRSPTGKKTSAAAASSSKCRASACIPTITAISSTTRVLRSCWN
jgi:hypothetical protein